MAIKKSELYSSFWKSCDELRGGMDASQYKDYVLVFLFVKYVSDKYAGQKGALIEVPEGGEGLLNDAKTDKDKLTKGSVKARLSEIKRDADSDEERQLLELCLGLMDQQASASKALKEGQKQLHTQVLAKYGQLTENEIKKLVVSDKWLATLRDCVQTELDRVFQRLTGRVKEFAERYASPLPALEQLVTECQSRVEKHLKKMGFDWVLVTREGRA